MNIAEQKTVYYIWLTLIFGYSSRSAWNISQKFDGVQEVLSAYKSKMLGKITDSANQKILSTGIEEAQDIYDYCSKNKIKIICCGEEEYPAKLKVLDIPPLVLYIRGNFDILKNHICVTIAGSRNADEYSLDLAYKISQQLSGPDFLVISGFAHGIDSSAHRGALDCNEKTAAVLGSGIYYDYPAGTFSFKGEISKEGVLVSEYPPLQPPRGSNFISRNRILAAFSDAVIIAEASLKSGSMNIASQAIGLSKEVYVVPPRDIFGGRFQGNIKLLKNGALPFYSVEELIVSFSERYDFQKDYSKYYNSYIQDKFVVAEAGNKKSRKRAGKSSENASEKSSRALEEGSSQKQSVQIQEDEKEENSALKNLSPEFLNIYNLIKEENPVHIDALVVKSGCGISELQNILLMLELSGLICAMAGNRFALK